MIFPTFLDLVFSLIQFDLLGKVIFKYVISYSGHGSLKCSLTALKTTSFKQHAFKPQFFWFSLPFLGVFYGEINWIFQLGVTISNSTTKVPVIMGYLTAGVLFLKHEWFFGGKHCPWTVWYNLQKYSREVSRGKGKILFRKKLALTEFYPIVSHKSSKRIM